jgi:hypothetical protein
MPIHGAGWPKHFHMRARGQASEGSGKTNKCNHLRSFIVFEEISQIFNVRAGCETRIRGGENQANWSQEQEIKSAIGKINSSCRKAARQKLEKQ